MAQDISGSWQEATDGYSYQSSRFTCRVHPDGRLSELKDEGTMLVREIYFRCNGGTERSAKRFVLQQQHAPEGAPLLFRHEEAAVHLRKRLVLGGEAVSRAARCSVDLYLSPAAIRLDYTSTLLVPISANGYVFLTHLRLPEEVFSGRGFRADLANGMPRLALFPFELIEAGGMKTPGLRSAQIAMNRGLFSIEAKDKGVLRLLDTPGWGGKFSAHVCPVTPWFQDPVLHPAGETFNWSLRITLTEHDEDLSRP